MLNGVGGRTIAEAKMNMTNAEVSQWVAFVNKRGSLNIGRRIEQAFGGFTATYLMSKGAKDVDPLAFMVHEEQEELSFEEQRLLAHKKKAL